MALCMFFYIPEKVSRPFNPSTTYVILWSWFNLLLFDRSTMYALLCSRYSLLPLWSQHNLCYSVFLIFSHTPAAQAQHMLFYVPDLVSRSFNTGTMYVILCSWYSILPLWPMHNLCYSVFLFLSPASATPAQCMLFYVHDLGSSTFNGGTMYVSMFLI